MHGHLSSSPPSWYTDYLLGLERLPRCGRCGKPQSLALQLELDSLPELGSGILQCFVCASQDCEVSEITCETWIIRAASAFQDDPRAFPVQSIVGWGEAYAELPDAFLWESVGVTVDSDTQDLVREAEGDPDHGDKLGGWPGQSSALPECPSCARPSSLLFQVASFDSVPKSFGLEGVLNIFSWDARSSRPSASSRASPSARASSAPARPASSASRP
jgi:hypothetical protein